MPQQSLSRGLLEGFLKFVSVFKEAREKVAFDYFSD
jgi:hypothetical protein